MFGITMIFAVCALITGSFIILELNWSIANIQRGLARKPGPLKILIIPLIPLYFMPVILDIMITLGVTMLIGTSGMMGMMVSMMVSSIVAGYLYYKRRKCGWRYI